MPPLKPLAEHNREACEARRRAREPHPNGLACPECRAELWDTDPCMVLASNPPQTRVHCPACEWVGYRVLP